MNAKETYRAIIIDDSEQARKLLRLMLSELEPDVTIIGEAAEAMSGLEMILKLNPQIVFLDIEMPGKSGIQMLNELAESNQSFEVIFTTAYNQYAIQALRLAAVDYLLKPIKETELSAAVQRVRVKNSQIPAIPVKSLVTNLTDQRQQNIVIPVLNGYEYFLLSSIEFLEADGSYVQIHLTDQKSKLISKNLKYFETALEGNADFIRVHRSFIINLKHMHRFSRSGRGTIVMKSGREIDLARDRRQDFFKAAGLD